MLTIGCHLSTTRLSGNGGDALSIGANTFAFFTRNPRGGKAKDLDMDDVAALRELMAQNDFGPLVAHAPYTYNPAPLRSGRASLPWRLWRKICSVWKHCPATTTTSIRCACGTGGRHRHSDDCRHAVPGDV